MAYSAIWDETLPTGAEAANTIGTIFRNLKRDVDERLIDIFGMPSFATDPLRPYVLKFSSVPGTNDIIPGATSFRFRDAANANNNLTISDAGNVVIRGTITGTLATAAQPAITSVGTLTGLTSANLTLDAAAHAANLTFKTGGARYAIITDGQNALGDGTTNLVVYADAGNAIMFIPNATSASKMTLTSAGNLTLAGSITGTINSNTEFSWNIVNNDVNTANYGTQASLHFQVGGVDVGSLKTTQKDLTGLVGRSLYLTTKGLYHVAFGINDTPTPVGYFHGSTGVFFGLNGIAAGSGIVSTTGVLRLATGTGLNWRNSGNSGDLAVLFTSGAITHLNGETSISLDLPTAITGTLGITGILTANAGINTTGTVNAGIVSATTINANTNLNIGAFMLYQADITPGVLVPTTSLLYREGGALKYKGTAGTVTVIAPA